MSLTDCGGLASNEESSSSQWKRARRSIGRRVSEATSFESRFLRPISQGCKVKQAVYDFATCDPRCAVGMRSMIQKSERGRSKTRKVEEPPTAVQTALDSSCIRTRRTDLPSLPAVDVSRIDKALSKCSCAFAVLSFDTVQDAVAQWTIRARYEVFCRPSQALSRNISSTKPSQGTVWQWTDTP